MEESKFLSISLATHKTPFLPFHTKPPFKPNSATITIHSATVDSPAAVSVASLSTTVITVGFSLHHRHHRWFLSPPPSSPLVSLYATVTVIFDRSTTACSSLHCQNYLCYSGPQPEPSSSPLTALCFVPVYAQMPISPACTVYGRASLISPSLSRLFLSFLSRFSLSVCLRCVCVLLNNTTNCQFVLHTLFY